MAVLCNFDWVPLPIMYPQLVVMAVHTYFIVCVFARQFVISEHAPNRTKVWHLSPFCTCHHLSPEVFHSSVQAPKELCKYFSFVKFLEKKEFSLWVSMTPKAFQMDVYFPMMTVLQFIFYMGWLKVAEAMLNPFGEDDDDFECNWLLDKNLGVNAFY